MTFGFLRRVGSRMFLLRCRSRIFPSCLGFVFLCLALTRFLLIGWFFSLSYVGLLHLLSSSVTLHLPQSPSKSCFCFLTVCLFLTLLRCVLFLYYPVSLKSEVSALAGAVFLLKNVNPLSDTRTKYWRESRFVLQHPRLQWT